MVKLNKNRSENFLASFLRGLDLAPGLRVVVSTTAFHALEFGV